MKFVQLFGVLLITNALLIQAEQVEENYKYLQLFSLVLKLFNKVRAQRVAMEK